MKTCTNCKHDSKSCFIEVGPCLSRSKWAPKVDRSIRGSVLDEAKGIITGERQDMYGSPEHSFKEIARRWSSYLQSMMPHGVILNILPEDVAHMMAELKMVRHLTKPKRDNLVDACGYLDIESSLRNATS